mmetsp:Transcript_150722/g.482262  ORF Transcript_150722/g.482262 Transcript_150722/m.482262 type:complete len:218 (-) Transcript_150722:896-1549(-)
MLLLSTRTLTWRCLLLMSQMLRQILPAPTFKVANPRRLPGQLSPPWEFRPIFPHRRLWATQLQRPLFQLSAPWAFRPLPHWRLWTFGWRWPPRQRRLKPMSPRRLWHRWPCHRGVRRMRLPLLLKAPAHVRRVLLSQLPLLLALLALQCRRQGRRRRRQWRRRRKCQQSPGPRWRQRRHPVAPQQDQWVRRDWRQLRLRPLCHACRLLCLPPIACMR